MPWVYKINARSFYLNGSYQFNARYSGRPGFKNDSVNECVRDKGPLPRGTYTIGLFSCQNKSMDDEAHALPRKSNVRA